MPQEAFERPRAWHTFRGLVLAISGLSWRVLGFDPGCPKAEALRVLQYLRDMGTMTKAELLRFFAKQQCLARESPACTAGLYGYVRVQITTPAAAPSPGAPISALTRPA